MPSSKGQGIHSPGAGRMLHRLDEVGRSVRRSIKIQSRQRCGRIRTRWMEGRSSRYLRWLSKLALQQPSKSSSWAQMTRQASSDLAKRWRSIDLSGSYHSAVVICDRTNIRTCRYSLQAPSEVWQK